MEQSNESRILELKRITSAMKWDISLMKDSEIKQHKQRQLQLYQKELNQLLEIFEKEIS